MYSTETRIPVTLRSLSYHDVSDVGNVTNLHILQYDKHLLCTLCNSVSLFLYTSRLLVE